MTLTRSRLVEDLRVLGVRAGDVVMVHASLRKVGLGHADHGEGGADLLLDALEEVVGPNGTLLMVLGTDYPMDHANLRPIEERAALLAGTPVFDPVTAAVLPEVGWLAEVLRRRPGTLVTNNPSGRFGARGARAEALLADAPWDDYYGPGSPLEKLCAAGGKILRLGANEDTVTALHYAEYLADVPDKRTTRWDYVLQGESGPEHRWTSCLNDADGIVEHAGDDYFAVILRAYLALGRHRGGRVGHADAELLEAADVVRFGAQWMTDNLRR